MLGRAAEARAELVKHLVDDAGELDNLLARVSERWIEEATEAGSARSAAAAGGGAEEEEAGDERSFGPSLDGDFLSPVDLGKYHVSAAALPLQKGDDVVEEERLVSLHQLQTAALRLHPSAPELCATRGRAIRRCLLHFESATLPVSSPVCPTLAAAQDMLTAGTLSFTVHSPEGFDFSAEFGQVYAAGQPSASRSAFGDFLAVCKRALVATDPGLADDRAEAFAKYMVRVAAWEHTIAHETAQQALAAELPHLKAFISSRGQSLVYSNVKLFVGLDRSSPVSSSGAVLRSTTNHGPSLCFWVRVCPLLEATAAPRGTAPETIRMEKRAERCAYFVYHRRFALTQRVVDEFKREHDRDKSDLELLRGGGQSSSSSALPPPPAAPPSRHHFSLALSVSQQPAVGADGEQQWSSAADDDEDEENAAAEAADLDTRSVLSGDTGIQTHQTHHTHRTSASHLSHLSAQTAASSTSCFVLKAPSQCAELLGWGQNLFSSLGIDDMNTRGGFTGAEGLGRPAAADSGAAAAAAAAEAAGSALQGRFYHPRPVPMPASLAMERIKMIACSPRHTLLLTVLGNVYCCGENSEGALGLGDLRPRSSITLLAWPVDPDAPSAPPPKIVKVAAGSGTIGSHSMAIDSQGLLYGWGVPYAVGHGGVKPVMSPLLIDTFPAASVGAQPPQQQPGDGNGNGNGNGNGEDAEQDDAETAPLVAARCKDVACGGGFTIVVLASGAVFSWGSFLFGKLGTGPTPTIYSARRGRSGGAKLARYQLRPARVWGVSRAESVSCGEAHALCLVQSGRVYAWGQNSCGQLGMGLTHSGYLRNSSRPVGVAPFAGASPAARARTVCCGAYHSAAIDVQGKVWTWGARGSACLGHNDPQIEGDWASRLNSIFSLSVTGRQVLVPFELQAWCRRWAVPRRVDLLSAIDAAQVSAGDLHTAVVSTRGHLFIWGSGAVAPPLASASLHLEQSRLADAEDEWGQADEGPGGGGGGGGDDDDDDEEDASTAELQGLSAQEAAARKRRAKRRLRRAQRVLSKATIVCTPRRPSASWLAGLSAKRTLLVSSSGGRCFVLQDEETVAAALTSPLLRRTIMGSAAGTSEFGDAAEVGEGGRPHTGTSVAADVADDASLDSYIRSDDGSGGGVGSSYFSQRGKADCIIIASGKVLLAHRALLAARSPELRDMVYQEMPSDEIAGGGFQPTQLLLPELRADSAKALLAFLYTDVLPQSCIGNVSLLRALVRVGKTLRLPRLQIICERLLGALAAAEQATDKSEELLRTTSSGFGRAQLGLELPPPTLARDLGNLVNDSEFADVRFIAEGRALYAHRFLLEMRCEYFRAMFRSGMAEQADGFGGQVDVVVPDTYVGFCRLLIFVYTDTLPDGSDGALLEDLMSADRYNVPDMKRVCESMLVPSAANWPDLLQAADIVNSPTLRTSVEGFLRDNFSVLASSSHPALQDGQTGTALLQDEFPGTLERIFESRREAYPSPPSHILAQRVTANAEVYEKKQLHNRPFPIWGAAVLAAGVIFYGQIHPHLVIGWTIPIFNGAILFLFLAYIFRGTVLNVLENGKRSSEGRQ